MVEQQRARKANKKMQDSIKLMHTSQGLQPPRSPISPEPVEEEIPSVDDMVAQLNSEGYLQQYANHYGYEIPPPPPPPIGPSTSGADLASQAFDALFGNIEDFSMRPSASSGQDNDGQ